MYTEKELEEMAKLPVEEADRAALADVKSLRIDRRKSVRERLEDYAARTGNPYIVKSGGYVLKFSYTDCGKSMEDRLEEYIAKIAPAGKNRI